jgi:hypothetical protein
MVTFFDLMVKIVSALNTFIRVDEQELTEEQQIMVRTNIAAASQPELVEVKAQVANIKADMEYVEILVMSISNNIGTVEMGTDVPEMTVTWTLNKTPKSQRLGGEDIGVDVRSMTVSMADRKSVTLTVTDERDATASKSTGYNAYNGIYYGVAANPQYPDSVDSAFIMGLTRTLSNTKGRTFTVNAAEDQRIWYALPSRLGAVSFAVGGFSGGFDLVATFKFTNASGYTEEYNVYASAKTGLGETKVVVS